MTSLHTVLLETSATLLAIDHLKQKFTRRSMIELAIFVISFCALFIWALVAQKKQGE